MKREWSLGELRAAAERLGVEPEDEDLERVLAFLAVLGPAFEELEHIVSAETVPAAQFLPVERA